MSLFSSLKSLYSHEYNRQRPVDALRRVAVWKVRQRRGQPWLGRTWDRDIWFYPDSRGSMFLAYNYVMDWAEFKFLEKYLRPTDRVVDIGANIGIYTLWISRFTKNIVAFEPDSVNAERLRQQIAMNRLDITIEESAVSNINGWANLSCDADMENHLVSEGGRKVRSVRLDDYPLNKIDFLKIDVEGAEHLVLQGAERLLSEKSIAVMQLEFNTPDQSSILEAQKLERGLSRFGYRLFNYDSASNCLVPYALGARSHENALAIANTELVSARLTSNKASSSGLFTHA
jgi:FkbM family methyltransferase